MFVFALVLACIAVIVFIFAGRAAKSASSVTSPAEDGAAASQLKWVTGLRWGGIAVAAFAGITLLVASTYTQDPGQAKVLRSWTGEIVGQSTTEGFKFKAPWVETIDYDIRNQQVIFGELATDMDAGNNGPQITVQDREGVTANIDISVRYSVNPDSVTEIYKRYQSQQNFVSRFIENDIRAAVRTIPAGYGTLELLNNRAEAESKIHDYLVNRWSKQGVTVETVSLQEIRYSNEVKSRFDEAQASRIRVEQAKADLEATEVSAQQKVVQAQAESDANAILNASLTEAILQQRYLDTLKELAAAGNLVVVPEGFNGLVNVTK